MSRLEKKCVIVSAGLHLLLLGILLVGPAFVGRKSTPDSLPSIEFIVWKTVDEPFSGGGNPNASPPAAVTPPPKVIPPAPTPEPIQPPAPTVQPAPEPVVKQAPKRRQPEPEPEKPAKPDTVAKPDPDAFLPKPEKKTRRPEISTNLVTRADSNKEAKKRAEEKARELAREEARAQAREMADARQRLAERIGQTAAQIGNGLSAGTSVEFKGAGGGGVPYANFLQVVQSVYDRAWIVPEGVTDNEATATVAVTIARDGQVIASRIERSSGNRAVDRSVQAALDKVSFVAPLPETSKDSERTVTINFNVRTKRGLG